MRSMRFSATLFASLALAPASNAGEAILATFAPSTQAGGNSFQSVSLDKNEVVAPFQTAFTVIAGGAPGEDLGSGAVYLRLESVKPDSGGGDPVAGVEYDIRIPHPEPQIGGFFGVQVKAELVDEQTGEVQLFVAAAGVPKVYVFKVVPGDPSPTVTLVQAIDEGLPQFSQFGRSIECSEDGDLMIGAPFLSIGGSTAAGSVFIYRKENGLFVKKQELTRNTPVPGELFGHPIAVNPDGTTIAVGAPGVNNGPLSSAGEIVICQGEAGSMQETTAVTDVTPEFLESFPQAITKIQEAPGSGGNQIAFVATSKFGQAASFDLDLTAGTATKKPLQDLMPGASPAAGTSASATERDDGSRSVAIGDPGLALGRVFVFIENESGELVFDKIIEPPPAAQAESFGTSIALSGNILLAGDPDADAGAQDNGEGYLFSVDGQPFFEDYGTGCSTDGAAPPTMSWSGSNAKGEIASLGCTQVPAGKPALIAVGTQKAELSFAPDCDFLVGGPNIILLGPFQADSSESLEFDFVLPDLGGVDIEIDSQLIIDLGNGDVAASNGASMKLDG